MQAARPGIAIITRPTRLQGLRQRWGTEGQAKFVLRAAHAHAAMAAPAKAAPGAAGRGSRAVNTPSGELPETDFELYEREEDAYESALAQLERDLDFGLPIKI